MSGCYRLSNKNKDKTTENLNNRKRRQTSKENKTQNVYQNFCKNYAKEQKSEPCWVFYCEA